MEYDDNRTSAEKLADRTAKAVILGGFASLGLLVLVGAATLLKLAF